MQANLPLLSGIVVALKANYLEVQLDLQELKSNNLDCTCVSQNYDQICVVENLADMWVIENTGIWNSPNLIMRVGQGVTEKIPKKPIKEVGASTARDFEIRCYAPFFHSRRCHNNLES